MQVGGESGTLTLPPMPHTGFSFNTTATDTGSSFDSTAERQDSHDAPADVTLTVCECAAPECSARFVVPHETPPATIVALCPGCADDRDSDRLIPGVGGSPVGWSA